MSERIPPSSRRLRRMASDLENEVSESRAEQLAARAVVRGRAQPGRNRRHVAVVVGLASVMFMLVGVGYGASKSLPGDPLYGVSRAYEGVGQFVGVVNPLEERLHEVIALAERGDRELAVQIASEALQELGRSADIALTSPATSTTTTPTTAPEPQDAAPAVVPDDEPATPSTTAAPATAESDEPAAPEETQEAEEVIEGDPIEDLKVAAQLLLNRVRDNGGELDDAAAGLAVAVSALTQVEEEVTTAEGDEATSTSTSTSTTTTTEPEEPSTSTTEPESTTSTTSTTVPEDEPGEGDQDPVEDDGPGPIIMPPEF